MGLIQDLETVQSGHNFPGGQAAILSHLESLSPLSDDDRALLASALGPVARLKARRQLIASGAALDEPAFVVSGWACRVVNLADGRRQILDFYIPGDLIGFSSRFGARAKASHLCLTNVVVARARELIRRVGHEPVRYAALAAALSAVEDEIEKGLIDQIVRTGGMGAHERMIHLIADLYRRHRRAGLAPDKGFEMPLKQEIVGDAVGLSTVHVNRVLQDLRREKIIATSARRIEIPDPDLLAERLLRLRRRPS